MSFSKKNRFSLKIIFLFLPFKIDNITLDPDPNWAKILDPDPKTKFNVFFYPQHCNKVRRVWYGRSVIRSAYKLCYEDAQVNGIQAVTTNFPFLSVWTSNQIWHGQQKKLFWEPKIFWRKKIPPWVQIILGALCLKISYFYCLLGYNRW